MKLSVIVPVYNVEKYLGKCLDSLVNQTISGLAQGRPIKGNVVFLGGPLHFLPQLRIQFEETLKTSAKSRLSALSTPSTR